MFNNPSSLYLKFWASKDSLNFVLFMMVHECCYDNYLMIGACCWWSLPLGHSLLFIIVIWLESILCYWWSLPYWIVIFILLMIFTILSSDLYYWWSSLLWFVLLMIITHLSLYFSPDLYIPWAEGGDCWQLQDWADPWPSSGALGGSGEPSYGEYITSC